MIIVSVRASVDAYLYTRVRLPHNLFFRLVHLRAQNAGVYNMRGGQKKNSSIQNDIADRLSQTRQKYSVTTVQNDEKTRFLVSRNN